MASTDEQAPVRVRIGVDTGGTFTDMVIIDQGTDRRRTVKVPSTPSDPARAVRTALENSGVDGSDVDSFVMGTTIATNCLIQRNGQRTAYVTTEGFQDVPFIQRIDRKGAHGLQWVKPEPYNKRRDSVGVTERVTHTGEAITPLTDAEVARVVSRLEALDAEVPGGVAVAVNLLCSYVNADHEQQLAAAIRAALPHAPLSVSSDVAPIWREYERGTTVIVDAYLRKMVSRFVEELVSSLAGYGIQSAPLMLKSNGGQTSVRSAGDKPVNLLISGLAGGMVAGKHIADGVDVKDAITLDMGGTSADVGLVVGGEIQSKSEYEFEWGVPIAVPAVDLTTIGAGGSSIAGFDQGGLLKVGPESAGADPGPAAYGKGGLEPTVTDANLVLGRLSPDYFLGGAVPLDMDLARDALAPLAERLGLSVENAAQAIIDVASENMASAIRFVSAERGVDYRRFWLIAFGGAGPLHASTLARRLGMKGVIVPPNPGLASAFGTLVGDLRVDRQTTRLLRSDHTNDDEVRAILRQVGREALDELRGEGYASSPSLALSVSARYAGQNFEQDVAIADPDRDRLCDAIYEGFHAAHERAYGYRIAEEPIEIVHFNAVASEPQARAPRLIGVPDGSSETPDPRRVYFGRDAGWVDVQVVRRGNLQIGEVVDGPSIIEEVDSTTLVLADEVAEVAGTGSLMIRSNDRL